MPDELWLGVSEALLHDEPECEGDVLLELEGDTVSDGEPDEEPEVLVERDTVKVAVSLPELHEVWVNDGDAVVHGETDGLRLPHDEALLQREDDPLLLCDLVGDADAQWEGEPDAQLEDDGDTEAEGLGLGEAEGEGLAVAQGDTDGEGDAVIEAHAEALAEPLGELLVEEDTLPEPLGETEGEGDNVADADEHCVAEVVGDRLLQVLGEGLPH